jgi:Zn-finger nucleic acid-binding protein
MEIPCPQGHGATVIAANEGHVGYHCLECGGIWVPAIEIDALARERHLDVDAFRARLADARTGEAAFACPHGHALTVTEYHDLELDWCRTCQGIWFEPRELRRLLDLHPNVFNRENVAHLLKLVGVFIVAPDPGDLGGM